MHISSGKKLLGVVIAGMLVIGALGYTAISLKKSRDAFTQALEASERKANLLTEKYREEKAQVGRLKRANMTLEGQVRQARMDFAKIEKELAVIREQTEVELKGRLDSCEAARTRLNQGLEKLSADFDRLQGQHRETTAALKAKEAENKTLNGQNQALNAEVRQAFQDNQRYRGHNVKLSRIAMELVGRIEKAGLGGSILVKEPVLQFKKVELEKLLQEYLDHIDEETAVN